MYKEIGVFDYSNKVLEKMHPGNFLTTKNGDTINTMIIGWGGVSIEWGKPIFIVLVRDCRATFDLIEASNEFTVSVPLENDLIEAIRVCGTKSLRDINKFEYCNLTPVKGRKIDTPIIGEAELHYECKVVYKQKLEKSAIPEAIKTRYYNPNTSNDFYHTVYYGEIIDQYIYEKE
ncbi:MAG: flavin reductase family protein [Tenericutes bacterium]|nr:flavin reductase family protein [Mycoplasmatota bacterium]